MARRSRAQKGKDAAAARSAASDARREAMTLVIAYVKQETVEPIRGIGRFVAFGVVGAIAIAVGTVLLLVAVLRALQTETGTFHGNLSWVPYLIVTVLAVAVMMLAAWRITAGPAERRIPVKKTDD